MDHKPLKVSHLDALRISGREGSSKSFYSGEVLVELLDEEGEVQETKQWEVNAIALPVIFLFSAFTKNASAPGITHLAVGTGPAPFNVLSPPELVSSTRLVGELTRKEISYTNYVDSGGSPTTEETNTVDLTTVFGLTEAVGEIVEMGLFGSFGAESRNGGRMVNYKAFPSFTKAANRVMRVTWRVRYTL